MPQLKGQPEPGTREWFRVSAKKGNAAEVFIYDEIGAGFFGGGIAAAELIQQLKSLKLVKGDTLIVRINSPGGNVFEGTAIHNYLRTMESQVVVRVDGVAASIASVIAMAGDRIEMPENAMMFIHNPMMLSIGNAAVMRKAAEDLDNVRDSMASSYLRRAGDKLTKETLYALLDAETWLSAQQSVDHGLADVVDEPVRAAALAQFDLSKYGLPVPKAILSAKKALVEDRTKQRARLQLFKT